MELNITKAQVKAGLLHLQGLSRSPRAPAPRSILRIKDEVLSQGLRKMAGSLYPGTESGHHLCLECSSPHCPQWRAPAAGPLRTWQMHSPCR